MCDYVHEQDVQTCNKIVKINSEKMVGLSCFIMLM